MYLYDVQSNIKIFHQKKDTIKAFFVFELVNPLPAKYLNFLRQFSDKAVQKPLTIHVIISTRHNRLRLDRIYRDSGDFLQIHYPYGAGRAHYAYPHTLESGINIVQCLLMLIFDFFPEATALFRTPYSLF